MSEGRGTNGFNATKYLNRYEDLLNEFGSDELSATRHYVNYGYLEGRSDSVIA